MAFSVCYADDAVDLNVASLDEITEKAKEEGTVESVGMPDTWANWGLSWMDRLFAEKIHTEAAQSFQVRRSVCRKSQELESPMFRWSS